MFRQCTVRRAISSSTMTLIRDLRFKTDAPIVDCKKALTEADNDMDKAIAWLRAKGAAGSVKKQGRDTAFGVMAAVIGKRDGVDAAALLQVCSETDFAARNEVFARYVDDVSADLAEMLPGGAAIPTAAPAPEEGQPQAPDVVATLDSEVAALVAKSGDKTAEVMRVLGENIKVRTAFAVPMPPHDPAALPRFTENAAPQFVLGRYVHNAAPGSSTGNVGGIVGVAGVWSYGGCEAPVTQGDADDLAQHVVAHLGDKSELVHQSFLGSEQTVGQWLKARHGALRSAAAIKFGDDQPVVKLPKAQSQHQQNKQHKKQ